MTKIITDAATLTKAIGAASKASLRLEADIQGCLSGAVYFAVKDGNIQPVNALFTTLGKGVRRAAIMAWLLEHAPVLANTDRDAAKTAPFVFSRPLIAELVETDKPTAEQAEAYATKAHATMWTEFKPELLVPESFDMQAMLSALVKKAKGLQAKGSKADHADLIAKVEALCAASSAKTEEVPAPL